ncbi:MAG: hypothetical protein Kow00121_57550 [Elainellaceae cyanobacterium]
MTNTAQKGLDALLEALEQEQETAETRRRFRGTVDADVFAGSNQANVANGRRGSDVLNGKAGNDNLSGGSGNDVLFGGEGADSLAGGANQDILFGNAGDDLLNGGGGNDTLDGGIGNDALLGANGNDLLVGGDGVDTLTGGAGVDQFAYGGNVFANGPTAPAGQTGIQILNQPDIVSDYTIGEDQFALDALDLGMDSLVFQKGAAAEITGASNVIVLTDPFAAAGAAARAIANNNNVSAQEGVFVYFNTTLGLSRAVYSKDLANGGDISVLANLDNQRGDAGLANLANFTAADFSLT